MVCLRCYFKLNLQNVFVCDDETTSHYSRGEGRDPALAQFKSAFELFHYWHVLKALITRSAAVIGRIIFASNQGFQVVTTTGSDTESVTTNKIPRHHLLPVGHLGKIRLERGRQRVVVRPAGELDSFLIDLKSIRLVPKG